MYVDKRLSVRETARKLGVHENTVRNWESKGILRAAKLPGSGFRRFDPSEVARLQSEMVEGLAPASEGPIIRPKSKPKIVRGDDS
ncbi:MAG: helix-turn-helix domain-containing protein [Actinobacteria bacterium]|nr:helix-turn-helix domain-containing protein [Actinomycetota bacterium]